MTLLSLSRRAFLSSLVAVFLAGCTTVVYDSSTPLFPHADPPKLCALCGAPTVAIGSIWDDTNRPSKNLSVWNRSICGNLMYGPDSAICTQCWQAYSPVMKQWSLALADRNGFRKPLHKELADFPLPEDGRIESVVIYEQKFDGKRLSEEVYIWCASDKAYLARAQAYAAAQSLSLNVERERLPGQSFLKIARDEN